MPSKDSWPVALVKMDKNTSKGISMHVTYRENCLHSHWHRFKNVQHFKTPATMICFAWQDRSLFSVSGKLQALCCWTKAAATRAPKLCLSPLQLPGLPSPSTARTREASPSWTFRSFGSFGVSFGCSACSPCSPSSPISPASSSFFFLFVRRFLLGGSDMAPQSTSSYSWQIRSCPDLQTLEKH